MFHDFDNPKHWVNDWYRRIGYQWCQWKYAFLSRNVNLDRIEILRYFIFLVLCDTFWMWTIVGFQRCRSPGLNWYSCQRFAFTHESLCIANWRNQYWRKKTHFFSKIQPKISCKNVDTKPYWHLKPCMGILDLKNVT